MSLAATTAMKKNAEKGGAKMRHRKKNRKAVEHQIKYWMAMPASPVQTKLFWVGVAKGPTIWRTLRSTKLLTCIQIIEYMKTLFT